MSAYFFYLVRVKYSIFGLSLPLFELPVHFIDMSSDDNFFLFDLGLMFQGNLLPAIDFVSRHKDCFYDILLLSTVNIQSPY